jgi:hypothetical protein
LRGFHGSRYGFRIRAHDICHSANFGSFPDFIRCCFAFTLAVSEGPKRNVQPYLVSISKTIGDRLGGRKDAHGDALDALALYAIGQRFVEKRTILSCGFSCFGGFCIARQFCSDGGNDLCRIDFVPHSGDSEVPVFGERSPRIIAGAIRVRYPIVYNLRLHREAKFTIDAKPHVLELSVRWCPVSKRAFCAACRARAPQTPTPLRCGLAREL